MPSLAFLLAVFAFYVLALQSHAEIVLFNGQDLSGWVRRGGKATYTVENGEIVGHSVSGTPNTFLCTEKSFGDFVLEYEFKVDPRLNSGVQFRSEVFDQPTERVLGGKTYKAGAGRVHGYQCEIDMDDTRGRWWSGGIYDEGRRGWLFPGPLGGDAAMFTEKGRAYSKPGEWNRVRIEAIGDSLKTWLNGEPRAAARDSATARGFIALQVHGIGKNQELEGLQVRWRNLVLTELPAGSPVPNTLTDAEKASGWRLLWDGATHDGLRSAKADTFPGGGWTVAGGVISVHDSGGEEARNGGDIITVGRFSTFELLVDFRLTPGANSGIKYLVQPGLPAIDPTGKTTAVGSAIGMEFQLLDDARHPDAKKGRDGNRTLGSLYDLLPASPAKKPNAVGEWNTARILVTERKVEHWLNGSLVLAYERSSPALRDAVARSKYRNIAGFGEWADGHILLQDHGDKVEFRSLKIRTPAAP
jgi:hypothetical protein